MATVIGDEDKPEIKDIENVLAESGNQNELKRDFKPHQVFMFSIACAIGTGLVISTGTSLVRGGPGSTLIAYLLIGAAVFFVMTSLGEMAAFLPMNKGFSGYASRMIDPALGYDSPLFLSRHGGVLTALRNIDLQQAGTTS